MTDDLDNDNLDADENPFMAPGQVGGEPLPPGVSGKKSSKASAQEAAERRENNKKMLSNMEELVVSLNDPANTYQQRIETLQSLTSTLIPTLFRECAADNPNVERSIVASRALMALKASSDMLSKKRDAEISDELNPYSPKFQLAFGWLIEAFYESLQEQNLEELQINAIFNDLSVTLTGMEDKLEKRLKGVAAKALATLESPFVTEFRNNLKERTKQAGLLDGDSAPEGVPLN